MCTDSWWWFKTKPAGHSHVANGRKALARRNRNLSSLKWKKERSWQDHFCFLKLFLKARQKLHTKAAGRIGPHTVRFHGEESFNGQPNRKEMYGNPPDRRCASRNSQLVRNPIMTHQVLLFYLVTWGSTFPWHLKRRDHIVTSKQRGHIIFLHQTCG